MAKSKRSKVKMAYKAMRRQVMERNMDEKLRQQAARTYAAIGLPLPPERTESQRMPNRTHNGSILVSTFVPTPKGPKLNLVHGPLAESDEATKVAPREIALAPVVTVERVEKMDSEEPVAFTERPYYYGSRRLRTGLTIKKRRRETRHPQNAIGVQF